MNGLGQFRGQGVEVWRLSERAVSEEHCLGGVLDQVMAYSPG